MVNTILLSNANIISAFNVLHYGAIGDGNTDDSEAIQTAIEQCDSSRGGTVYFPQGRYRISRGLVIVNQGTELVGEGKPGASREQSIGSSCIISDDGITAITCNPDISSHLTLGFAFRRLQIMAAAGSSNGSGILVQNAEMLLIENVTCSDYRNGTGLQLNGGGGNSQYAELYNFSAGDCKIGLHTSGIGPNGLRLFGGYFAGRGTAPRVGSRAIHIESGDTLRSFGTVIQGYETGIYIDSSAAGHELYGARIEYCNVGVKLGSRVNGFSMFGGCISNSILVNEGAGNVGIFVDAGAKGVNLNPTYIDGTVEAIVGGERTLARRFTYLPIDREIVISGSFYDGPSLKLPPGQWNVIGSIGIQAGSNGQRTWIAHIVVDGSIISTAALTVTSGLSSITIVGIVSLEATSTVTVVVTSDVAGDTIKGLPFKVSYLGAVLLIASAGDLAEISNRP